jgi:hypothetical protein
MPEPAAEPKRSFLRHLLERPDARPRVRRAVASLLGVTVATIGVFGLFVIWHLVRRGRLIRDRLPAPKAGAGLDWRDPRRSPDGREGIGGDVEREREIEERKDDANDHQ